MESRIVQVTNLEVSYKGNFKGGYGIYVLRHLKEEMTWAIYKRLWFINMVVWENSA